MDSLFQFIGFEPATILVVFQTSNRYFDARERCSSGPNTGFEIFVPGRQDGFGHKSCLQERQSPWAHRLTLFCLEWPEESSHVAT